MKKLTIKYTDNNKQRQFIYAVPEVESISTTSDNIYTRLIINGKEVITAISTEFSNLSIEVDDIIIQ